jgi:uncharacterized membrane protein YebE (DUF533 family)
VRIEDLLLGSLIHGALGARGKPHLRAAQFLTGGMPRFGIGLNLGTMIGAAGLAWGAYEHFKDRNPSVMTTIEGGGFPASVPPPLPPVPGPQGFSSPPPPPPASTQGSSMRPPPLPGASFSTDAQVSSSPSSSSSSSSASTPPGPDALRRLVALTIAAARSDGDLGEEEYGQILAAAREHGAEKLVAEELANRRTIQEIVVGAMDPKFREHLYALAYGIVRADSSISAAERKWLRELALALDFDSQAAARIEQETANKIDRQIG